MYLIRSYKHGLYTTEVNKKVLALMDDKRYVYTAGWH